MNTPILLDIPWRSIRPMNSQPREHFDPGKLRELADSIAAIGQVTPAKVSPLASAESRGKGHAYELIDGQRRWHAVQMAGLATLRAEVVDEPDAERRFALSVVANFAREPHHHMEIAHAIRRMKKSMTVEQVCATLGRSAAYVEQHSTLLKLHEDLQELLHPSTSKAARLPFTAAVQLARLDRGRQLEAYAKIRASELSPLKATAVVLEDLEQGERKGEGRIYGKGTGPARDAYHLFRDYNSRLLRMRTTLERMDTAEVERLLAGREPGDRNRLVSDLEKIRDRADDLIGEIGAAGPKANGRAKGVPA